VIITITLNPSLDRTLAVPQLAWNEVLRATASRLDWGGKGFNVSRALKALGTDSLAMGLMGGDTGERLERGLRALGIDTDLVPIAGETRTNTVVAEEARERYLKVNEPGPAVRADELSAFLDRVRARLRPGDLWVLAGGLPPGAPPDYYTQLIGLIQKGGSRPLLDTSGEPLRLGCAAGPYLVKPNVAEAEELTGQEIRSAADALRAARLCLGQGVVLVALSMGAAGLLLAAEGQAVHAVPPCVRVRVPVGTGDALLAGLTWALEKGRPLAEMARWGVAAGTAAAMREGVGMGTAQEVQAVYELVQTKALA
jgi:1-phosphofructokinase family hexose kinase